MRIGLLVCLLFLSSCISVNWKRWNWHEPVTDAQLTHLEAGRSTLGDCLSTLGAPNEIAEYRGSGAALTYSWLNQRHLGFSISYSLGQMSELSMNYDDHDINIEAVVLLFDEDLMLEVVRRGFLADMAPNSRRPASLETDN